MWLFYYMVFLCVYTLANALLHDYFVIKKHQGPYDRNLLRLLMDGHILLISGFLYLIAACLFQDDQSASYLICIVAAGSLVAYCLMIWPFLKSIVTLIVNLIMLVAALIKLLNIDDVLGYWNS